jgi:hypothetical protein
MTNHSENGSNTMLNGDIPVSINNGKIDLSNIEFEYVNMDENILAPGRVRIYIR